MGLKIYLYALVVVITLLIPIKTFADMSPVGYAPYRIDIKKDGAAYSGNAIIIVYYCADKVGVANPSGICKTYKREVNDFPWKTDFNNPIDCYKGICSTGLNLSRYPKVEIKLDGNTALLVNRKKMSFGDTYVINVKGESAYISAPFLQNIPFKFLALLLPVLLVPYIVTIFIEAVVLLFLIKEFRKNLKIFLPVFLIANFITLLIVWGLYLASFSTLSATELFAVLAETFILLRVFSKKGVVVPNRKIFIAVFLANFLSMFLPLIYTVFFVQ